MGGRRRREGGERARTGAPAAAASPAEVSRVACLRCDGAAAADGETEAAATGARTVAAAEREWGSRRTQRRRMHEQVRRGAGISSGSSRGSRRAVETGPQSERRALSEGKAAAAGSGSHGGGDGIGALSGERTRTGARAATAEASQAGPSRGGGSTRRRDGSSEYRCENRSGRGGGVGIKAHAAAKNARAGAPSCVKSSDRTEPPSE